jgi:hypothetical protein
MSPSFLLQGRLADGLFALLQAFDFSQDVAADVRVFAVELSVLVNSGLSANQLRWLVLKGYAEHYIERRPRGNEGRSLVAAKSLNFRTLSRFVLTAAGADFVGSICRRPAEQVAARIVDKELQDDSAGNEPQLKPHWDRRLRQLTFDGVLIKTFSRAAVNQMPVLDKFQALNWCSPIDAAEFLLGRSRRKHWLHETINSLNDGHKIRKIHFFADGTTNGICWTLDSRRAWRGRKRLSQSKRRTRKSSPSHVSRTTGSAKKRSRKS